MFSKKRWFRKKRNLCCDDMRQRVYIDQDISCNHVNTTIENENTVWKLRGCQGESSPYLKPLCRELIMKETVLCGPDIKSRPLLPLPSTPPSNDIYDYISDYIQPGSPCEIQERTHYERRTVEFKELIITCVDVLQILPHLTFVEYPQSYRIVANTKSGREATQTLIDDIQKSEVPGRWRQFVQALERCGYDYVVKCIKGQLVQDKSCQKEFLKIMSVAIRKCITPTELTPFLWAHGVINDEDKQRIECQQTTHGEIQAADMLLEIIPTKVENWYRLFVDSLLTAKLTDVAKLLDIHEIMDIPSADQTSTCKTELVISKSGSGSENICANPNGQKSIPVLEKISAIVYVPEGTTDANVIAIQGRTTNPQLFQTYDEQYEGPEDAALFCSGKHSSDIEMKYQELHYENVKGSIENIHSTKCIISQNCDIDKPGKSSSGGSKQKDSCEENKNAPPLPPRITLEEEAAEKSESETCDFYMIFPAHKDIKNFDKPGRCSSGGAQKDSCEENKNAPPLPPRITLDFDKPGKSSSGGSKRKDSCEENINAPPLPSQRITLEKVEAENSDSETYDDCYLIATAHKEIKHSARLETFVGKCASDPTYKASKEPSLSPERTLLTQDVFYSESSKKIQTVNNLTEKVKKNEVNTTFTRQKLPKEVGTHKPVRYASSLQLLKDSLCLKDLADADCDQLLIEKERFKRATERLQAELEHLEDIHQLKHVITEMGAKKVQLVRDVSKVDEKYFALREDILDITEGKVHMEVSDEQYSDKGLYSAKQLSQTTLEKETTRNEQVTDLPNDEYRQVVKPNRKFHSYKDSAYMSDMGTMYEEQETAED
ncbi:uncharacterized protein LOC128217809 [Mya arenaria]|uniref:uncharacterized protein LOC128217809 n=1 Tax=Mya arenaria TaxID=6604 RepID=UPI0022E8FA29|nr:uncharacterized protein LOC128217809 [Mya arenaria]